MTKKHRELGVRVELAVVIACKLLFIFCLWYFFFSPEHRTEVTPEVVSEAFFSDTRTTSVSP